MRMVEDGIEQQQYYPCCYQSTPLTLASATYPLVVHQPASPSIWPVLLLMCGGGMRSILLLPLVARCIETIDVCIWRMFVFMSVVVTVWGSV